MLIEFFYAQVCSQENNSQARKKSTLDLQVFYFLSSWQNFGVAYLPHHYSISCHLLLDSSLQTNLFKRLESDVISNSCQITYPRHFSSIY